MQLVIFKPKEMTVVYVRRRNAISIKTIIEFSNSLYNVGCLDFIVVDLCRDSFALDCLAKNGDPFRYFGFDSGITVNDILSDPRKYSCFSDIIVIDQNDEI